LGQFTNEFSEQISKCEPEVDSETLKSGTTTGKGNKSDPDVGSLWGSNSQMSLHNKIPKM
jgi:hypothetical protein